MDVMVTSIFLKNIHLETILIENVNIWCSLSVVSSEEMAKCEKNTFRQKSTNLLVAFELHELTSKVPYIRREIRARWYSWKKIGRKWLNDGFSGNTPIFYYFLLKVFKGPLTLPKNLGFNETTPGFKFLLQKTRETAVIRQSFTETDKKNGDFPLHNKRCTKYQQPCSVRVVKLYLNCVK